MQTATVIDVDNGGPRSQKTAASDAAVLLLLEVFLWVLCLLRKTKLELMLLLLLPLLPSVFLSLTDAQLLTLFLVLVLVFLLSILLLLSLLLSL